MEKKFTLYDIANMFSTLQSCNLINEHQNWLSVFFPLMAENIRAVFCIKCILYYITVSRMKYFIISAVKLKNSAGKFLEAFFLIQSLEVYLTDILEFLIKYKSPTCKHE